MIYDRLATAALFAGLFSAVFGSAAGEGQSAEDPLSGLARRGVSSARLNELYFGAPNGETCDCSLACEILATEFGKRQVSAFGQDAYDASLARFWSNLQAQTHPKCFFHPRDAEEVSVMILLSQATQCPFAVKGAGHAAFKGSSNSDGGITVEFSHMNQVVPSTDRKTVSIGPGNNWLNVYSTLEPHNLTVIGGRVSSVGVSGLLLGGGMSFFTGQHGWACDNIVNYEVVLASGDIVDVNVDSYPDLFWALRGGGGNFGIVTRFDVNAFELNGGVMWGGDIMYEFHGSKAAVAEASVRFATEGYSKDPKAHFISSFAYAQVYNMWVTDVMLDHAEPQPEGSHPAVFDDFFLENPVASTLKTNSLANLTIAIDATSPFGFRNSYWSLTTQMDVKLMEDILSIWEEEVDPVKNITAILPAISFQAITTSQLKSMTRNGGNALGIGGGDKPLLIYVVSMMWALDSDDELVLTAAHNIVTRSGALARERGLDSPYLCQYQDVYASYPENKKRLIEIAKKYDPMDVFQKLHPGYFKLNGAPAVW